MTAFRSHDKYYRIIIDPDFIFCVSVQK